MGIEVSTVSCDSAILQLLLQKILRSVKSFVVVINWTEEIYSSQLPHTPVAGITRGQVILLTERPTFKITEKCTEEIMQAERKGL